jgi:hypothetical protein
LTNLPTSPVKLIFSTDTSSPNTLFRTVASAATTSTAPCTQSTSKIEGGAATNYCGPATAKLRVSGKTYTFKHGFCQSIPRFENDIALGTFAKGKTNSGTADNGGKPYFRLDLGPGQSSDLALTYSGGNLLDSEGPASWKGTVTSKGTFKSLSRVPASFSGSWNCHGVFVNAAG